MKGSLLSLSIVLFLITMVTAQSRNQTRLKIAVPPKSGFTQFVRVIRDPITGQLNFSGFAIEVFNQAVSATVDKSISFDFIPFQRPDGTMNGSYDDMVEAVYNKQYDGAVGDITIRFSRTQWVDFTVPYTDIGISMLIPIKQQMNEGGNNSIISLTREMVIGTFVVFFVSVVVFVGADIVDLVFGRTRDKTIQPTRPVDGDDPDPTNHLKERKDAWKREVLGTVKGTRLMTLLCFLILLFSITYYATSLTSLLAREHSSPPNKSLNQIIRTGERVGYYGGSFVYNLLKEYGIPDRQLVAYRSEDELLDLLSKKPEEGGVTVAIDETSPLSVFLAQHCNKYSIHPIPSLHSFGYGFAFPIGSSLVQEISNGIIKMIDNGQLGRIQARTIGGDGTCDVDSDVDIVSDISAPDYPRTFRACAILSVALLLITYLIFIITTNGRCLRYLYP